MDYTIHKLCEHAFMLEHEINSELYRNIRTRRDRYLRKCLRRARDAYTLEMIQELEYHEDTFSVCCTLFEDIEYIVHCRALDISLIVGSWTQIGLQGDTKCNQLIKKIFN